MDGDELLSVDPSGSTNARLDEIAAGYDPSDPSQHFDYHLKRLQMRAITPWLQGDRVLELGCATGELTSLLAPLATVYDVVGAVYVTSPAYIRQSDSIWGGRNATIEIPRERAVDIDTEMDLRLAELLLQGNKS